MLLSYNFVINDFDKKNFAQNFLSKWFHFISLCYIIFLERDGVANDKS